jgi:15-cis-phytoene synthase
MESSNVSANPGRSQRPPERTYVTLSVVDVERGYRACQRIAKKAFGPRLWPLLNLPADVRQGIDAVLFVVQHGWEAYRKERPTGQIAFETLNEAREDLNDACCGKYLSAEWGAVHDTIQRWQIPKQFLFDYYEGIDHLLRFRQPQSDGDVAVLATRLGGAPLVAAVQIMGVKKPGFEVHALECGQALLITEWLLSARQQAASGKLFLASQDLAEAGCDRETLASSNYSKPIDYLVRRVTSRLEKTFHHSAELFDYLDFDAHRTLHAMVGAAWRAILKLQREPRHLFASEGPVSKNDLFREKMRFILGLSDKLPFDQPHAH